jgi:hypothetical protein
MAEASLDLQNGYKVINSKIKSSRTYLEVKKDAEKIRKEQNDNLEQLKKNVTTNIEDLKNSKKRYQREIKTQLDHMLDIIKSNNGSGNDTIRYIKKTFVETAVRISPKIKDILISESIKALGCSQQQKYGNQTFYIKVGSIDIQNLLKTNPKDTLGSLFYEKNPPIKGNIPYSMNRELWDRLQQLNTTVSYFGASGQKLFDITYVDTDGTNLGDFYKIDLDNRLNGVNKVADFILDYYSSIQIVDTNNLFAQLMNQLSGAISFQANLGVTEINEKNTFLLILQRILGLCFDSRQQIDVSGNAKIGELDSVDDSFFELTNIDLRNLEDNLSNIQNGVVEFEDCGTVKLPVNSQDVIDGLLKLNGNLTLQEEEAAIMSLTETLTNNPNWNLLVPNIDINLTVNLQFIKDLPKAIFTALLTPKVLLPLFIMSKAIKQNIVDSVETILDFLKTFKTYVINVMSKIGSLFIEQLFEIIKKDIKILISTILKDITKEKILKKYTIVLKLVSVILVVANFVQDYRKCKSVIDDILNLLNLASKSSGFSIPAPILAATELLEGFSVQRAFINVIDEYQKLGLPTGPMPDGSPNLMLQAKFAEIFSIQKEENENGKVQVFIKPLTVTPAGLTLPAGNIFGKKL